MTGGMLSVEEARARLLALVAPAGSEAVPLAEAGGRVLAADAVATRDQPPFAASAMDGYALRAADAFPGATLRLVGVSQAGARYEEPLGPGEATRIYTGAPLPEGADAVLIQEEAEATGEQVVVGAALRPGENVRPAGGDFRAGHRLAAPLRLGPPEVALLAAMNIARPVVARRPVVALIPTGDELAPLGTEPGRDQIHPSNNYGLKVLFDSAGAEVRLLPIARDTPEALADAIALAAGADLVVTLGGASVGDFDLVRATAAAEGMELDFYKVAIRPGKPLLAGRIGRRVLVGLPGNPVSALVCSLVFVVPAIERMLGLPGDPPAPIAGRLAVGVEANGPRAHYMRARVEQGIDGWRCTPYPSQDSSQLAVLAASNALVIREPRAPALQPGDSVEFLWLK